MNVIVLFGFVLGALSAAATVIKTKPRQSVTLESGLCTFKNSLGWYHRDILIFEIFGKSGIHRKGQAAIKDRSRARHDNSLVISDVRKEDTGIFTCKADGVPHEYTLLVVSVSASPSEELQVGRNGTLQCEVEGLKLDRPVEWTGPDGRKLSGSPNVLKSVTLSDAGTWQCGFSYGGVMYTEDLKIKVKGPAVTSPPGSEVNTVTSCPNCGTGTTGGGGQLDWWMWAVVGAGCVVVVLLLALVIIFCRRIRRRKRQLQKKKNGQQSQGPKNYCQCNSRPAAAKAQRGRQKGRPSTLALKPLLKE